MQNYILFNLSFFLIIKKLWPFPIYGYAEWLQDDSPTDNSPADNSPNEQFTRGQFTHGQFAHNYCFFVKIYEFMD